MAEAEAKKLFARLMLDADKAVRSTVSEADALEFRREQYQLSMKEFALILGIQPSHYSETIRGQRRLPVASIARAIAVGVLPWPLLANRKPLKIARSKGANHG